MRSLRSPRAALWEALDALCPLHLAGGWDQVGPMVDPPVTRVGPERIFLTIDLTEEVYEEARELGATVIIAYHPLLFHPLKRLDQRSAISRVAMSAVSDGVAIYSPHSALDAVSGGICDWLVTLFEDRGPLQVAPIEPEPSSPEEGAGRLLTLSHGCTLSELIERVKQGLGLSYLRVAASGELSSEGALVERIALCPGAGGGLFARLPAASAGGPQLLLTGEMSHHEVLGRVREGGAVLLTEHSNCERGYLSRYAARLSSALPTELCAAVLISARDRDPLSLA